MTDERSETNPHGIPREVVLRQGEDASYKTASSIFENEKPSHEWPTLPARERRSIASNMSSIVVDVLFMACSSAFFAFALTVRSYDQAPIAEHQRLVVTLQEASRYGPTVFPILFACVIGRAAQAILQWRLERGARAGCVDTLSGSTSLASFVATQMRLRIFSVLGITLLAIWTLSPIGGQASLRLMSLGEASSTDAATFTHWAPGLNLSRYVRPDGDSDQAIANGLFIASIVAPAETKHSSLDVWNNVKVPMIEQYEAVHAAEEDGWYNVDASAPVYSSLVGMPIRGLAKSPSVNYTLAIETSYFHLHCPVVNATATSSASLARLLLPGLEAYNALMFSPDIMTARTEADLFAQQPREFTYYTWGSTGVSNCTITTTYVEAQVVCDASTACTVSRLRRSQQPQPPPEITALDSYAGAGVSNWDVFTDAFTKSVLGRNYSDTVVQDYLLEPDNPLMVHRDGFTLQPLTNEGYAIRLGQLVNTYCACLTGVSAIAGGVTPDTVSIEGVQASESNSLLGDSEIVTGTKTTSYAVIEAQSGWIAALCIISIVMIIASLTPSIVRFFFIKVSAVALDVSSHEKR